MTTLHLKSELSVMAFVTVFDGADGAAAGGGGGGGDVDGDGDGDGVVM